MQTESGIKRTHAINRLCASNLSVDDLMSKNVFVIHPEDSLEKAAETMVDYNIHHLPVVDSKKKLVGLISHRDLLRYSLSELRTNQKIQKAWLTGIRVQEIMQRDSLGKVMSVKTGTPLRSVAIEMLERRFGCVPVVDSNHTVCGIITESDFARMFAEGA